MNDIFIVTNRKEDNEIFKYFKDDKDLLENEDDFLGLDCLVSETPTVHEEKLSNSSSLESSIKLKDCKVVLRDCRPFISSLTDYNKELIISKHDFIENKEIKDVIIKTSQSKYKAELSHKKYNSQYSSSMPPNNRRYNLTNKVCHNLRKTTNSSLRGQKRSTSESFGNGWSRKILWNESGEGEISYVITPSKERIKSITALKGYLIKEGLPANNIDYYFPTDLMPKNKTNPILKSKRPHIEKNVAEEPNILLEKSTEVKNSIHRLSIDVDKDCEPRLKVTVKDEESIQPVSTPIEENATCTNTTSNSPSIKCGLLQLQNVNINTAVIVKRKRGRPRKHFHSSTTQLPISKENRICRKLTKRRIVKPTKYTDVRDYEIRKTRNGRRIDLHKNSHLNSGNYNTRNKYTSYILKRSKRIVHKLNLPTVCKILSKRKQKVDAEKKCIYLKSSQNNFKNENNAQNEKDDYLKTETSQEHEEMINQESRITEDRNSTHGPNSKHRIKPHAFEVFKKKQNKNMKLRRKLNSPNLNQNSVQNECHDQIKIEHSRTDFEKSCVVIDKTETREDEELTISKLPQLGSCTNSQPKKVNANVQYVPRTYYLPHLAMVRSLKDAVKHVHYSVVNDDVKHQLQGYESITRKFRPISRSCFKNLTEELSSDDKINKEITEKKESLWRVSKQVESNGNHTFCLLSTKGDIASVIPVPAQTNINTASFNVELLKTNTFKTSQSVNIDELCNSNEDSNCCSCTKNQCQSMYCECVSNGIPCDNCSEEDCQNSDKTYKDMLKEEYLRPILPGNKSIAKTLKESLQSQYSQAVNYNKKKITKQCYNMHWDIDPNDLQEAGALMKLRCAVRWSPKENLVEEVQPQPDDVDLSESIETPITYQCCGRLIEESLYDTDPVVCHDCFYKCYICSTSAGELLYECETCSYLYHLECLGEDFYHLCHCILHQPSDVLQLLSGDSCSAQMPIRNRRKFNAGMHEEQDKVYEILNQTVLLLSTDLYNAYLDSLEDDIRTVDSLLESSSRHATNDAKRLKDNTSEDENNTASIASFQVVPNILTNLDSIIEKKTSDNYYENCINSIQEIEENEELFKLKQNIVKQQESFCIKNWLKEVKEKLLLLICENNKNDKKEHLLADLELLNMKGLTPGQSKLVLQHTRKHKTSSESDFNEEVLLPPYQMISPSKDLDLIYKHKNMGLISDYSYNNKESNANTDQISQKDPKTLGLHEKDEDDSFNDPCDSIIFTKINTDANAKVYRDNSTYENTKVGQDDNTDCLSLNGNCKRKHDEIDNLIFKRPKLAEVVSVEDKNEVLSQDDSETSSDDINSVSDFIAEINCNPINGIEANFELQEKEVLYQDSNVLKDSVKKVLSNYSRNIYYKDYKLRDCFVKLELIH